MQNNRRVNIAILGLGRIAQVHMRNLVHNVSSACVCKLMDVRLDAARKMSEAYGGISYSNSLEEILDDPKVEAVLIASPSTLHVGMIKSCAAAGKQIFCEKPLGLDSAGTAEALAAVKAAGVRLQVGFQLRFVPSFRQVREMVQRGELGQIYMFRFSHRDMKPPTLDFLKTSGGLMADVSVHDFDLARYLIGEIDEVTAVGTAVSLGFAETGDVDNALVTVRFANGAIGSIDNTRVAGYGSDMSGEIIGSLGAVRFGPEVMKGPTVLRPELVTRAHFVRLFEYTNDAYVSELESFCRRVVRDGLEPESSGPEAAAAFELAKAAELSMRDKRTVVLEHTGSGTDVVYKVPE